MELKSNELRIGNFVLDIDNDILSISEITKDYVSFNKCNLKSRYSKIKPIPLTEEWLLKFGKKAEKNDNYGGFIIYYPNGNGMRIKNNEWSSQHISVKLEFVHQLQNLYYALTNEELKLK